MRPGPGDPNWIPIPKPPLGWCEYSPPTSIAYKATYWIKWVIWKIRYAIRNLRVRMRGWNGHA